MPEYDVRIEEVYDQCVEEIGRAWRNSTRTRVIRVEADSEEEAMELAQDGYGDEMDEDYDYGDFYDSEVYDYGDVLDEEYVETNVDVRISPTSPDYTHAFRRRNIYHTFAGYSQQREPDWEV